MTIDTTGTNFDSQIHIFAEDDSLIARDITATPFNNVDFFIVNSQTIRIRVSGDLITGGIADEGCIAMNINFSDTPPNDKDFNAIQMFDPFSFSTSGFNNNATTDPGEPDIERTGSTVWWRYFPSFEASLVTIDTFGSNFDTQLHVYNDQGQLLASNNDDGGSLQSRVQFFNPNPNTFFQIRVGGYRPNSDAQAAEGNIVLNLDQDFIVLGDVNCDGAVNLQDVAPFVNLLSNGLYEIKADINQDGAVNLQDIGPFVALISGG